MHIYTYIDIYIYVYIHIYLHIHIYVRRCVAANAHSKPLLLPSSTFPINQGCTSQTIPTARPTWLAIACCHPRSTERAHVI